MRIARFTTGDDPMFGIIKEKDGIDYIYGLSGDPLYTQINPNGVILPLSEVRLLAPVIPRSKIVGVGNNYALEGEVTKPTYAMFFLKPNTAVIGPGDPIVIPEGVEQVAMECEIAVVIKRLAKQVSVENALDYVFGYTIANDLTARDIQQAENQWLRAKAFDTSCPLGPYIETELDTSDLKLSAYIGERQIQSDSSKRMITSIAEQIAQISAFTTLLPGDVILTGTPARGADLPADHADITVSKICAVEVEGLGRLENRVIRSSELN